MRLKEFWHVLSFVSPVVILGTACDKTYFLGTCDELDYLDNYDLLLQKEVVSVSASDGSIFVRIEDREGY